jgi:hypothetical protein
MSGDAHVRMGRLRRSRVLAAAGSPPCATEPNTFSATLRACSGVILPIAPNVTRRVGAPRPLPDLY